MRFIGIDVHKNQSQICILDEQGCIELEARVSTTRPDLADRLAPFLPARVVIEASTPSEWVARHLESLGFEVIVADPGFAPMYATRDKRVKTDKRDAPALAQACKLGAYRAAHRLSDEQRAVRTQIQVRQTLVQTRTKLINQIRAELLRAGYRVAPGAAEHFEQRLKPLDLGPPMQALLSPLLSMLAPLSERIEQLDKQLGQRATQDPAAVRLQQIPGVGPIISLMFLAVLDGAERFQGAHQVMSYLGLVPREYSSGEKQHRGHITKAGHRQMRALMVQAANGVMRLKKPQTERLHQWAEQIKLRRGKNIATVALARKLVGVMWAMVRDGTDYQAPVPKPMGSRAPARACGPQESNRRAA
jgi:transposase